MGVVKEGICPCRLATVSMKGFDQAMEMCVLSEFEDNLMVGCVGDDTNIDCILWPG